jgi:hypothetical protein
VGGESGQAAVEAAIVLPAAIVLLLCTIQLAQLQQARLMASYAAFNAARTGIVRNGDNGATGGVADGAMREAAIVSVLPTYGRSDSFAALSTTLAGFAVRDAALRLSGVGAVRVTVLSPRKEDFARLGGHLAGREIDFDDVRPAAAAATLLSIHVRYLYELRVPFANKLIQTLWLATKRGARIDDGTPEGIDPGALALAARQGRYLVPVQASYTMRMQSNPFARWAAP